MSVHLHTYIVDSVYIEFVSSDCQFFRRLRHHTLRLNSPLSPLGLPAARRSFTSRVVETPGFLVSSASLLRFLLLASFCTEPAAIATAFSAWPATSQARSVVQPGCAPCVFLSGPVFATSLSFNLCVFCASIYRTLLRDFIHSFLLFFFVSDGNHSTDFILYFNILETSFKRI